MKDLDIVVKTDLEAAVNAFKINDFTNMNIFANRAMADSIFSDDLGLALPGFFMKELVGMFGALEVRGGTDQPPFSTAKVIGDQYAESVLKLLTEKGFEETSLWKGFYEMCIKIRPFLMIQLEEKMYKEQMDFTKHAFNWLINWLNSRKETLLQPQGMLLKGVLNEMDRIFRTSGGDLSSIYAISLIRMLDRYHEYCLVACTKQNGTLDQDKIGSMMFPQVERIHALFSSGSEIETSAVDQILLDLIRCWRQLFIEYMDVHVKGELERAIQLPEEVRKRITESVTKILEKDVSVSKRRGKK